MSAFTNATSSSGILRSEIPQQCLTEIKTGVMDMLDSFCEKKVSWTKMIECIKNWTAEDINDEVQALLQIFPDAKQNFQYTILKAIKNISVRNGSSNTKVKLSKLQEISFEKFYRDFAQTIVNMPDLKSKNKYTSLRPSDKEIIARDSFRRVLYSHSRDLFTHLIDEPKAIVEPIVETNNDIGFDDSVSQAPSEIISIRQSDDDRLNNSIMKLHIDNGEQEVEMKAGGQSNRHSRVSKAKTTISYKKIPSIVSRKDKNDAYFFSQVSRKSKVPSSNSRKDDVINVEIQTNTKTSRKSHRTKSHFSRSPKIEKPLVPCFFDEDGINMNDADVATVV